MLFKHLPICKKEKILSNSNNQKPIKKHENKKKETPKTLIQTICI